MKSKGKKYHAWQSAQHLCTSIKKWSKRNKADYNLRSGPILAVLIHSLLRSLFSFRLAHRIGPILKRTHRAQRKFLCSCYQLFALVGPPGFALFTITSTWFDTYLLTYLPIFVFLCYSLCPSMFVCLSFFWFLKRSGLVLRSCRVSPSPFDFHIESSKCCDPWISGLAWRTITQFWGPWFVVLSESIREKTESNLAAKISIHIVIHIVTCQRMILNAFSQAGLMRF